MAIMFRIIEHETQNHCGGAEKTDHVSAGFCSRQNTSAEGVLSHLDHSEDFTNHQGDTLMGGDLAFLLVSPTPYLSQNVVVSFAFDRVFAEICKRSRRIFI